MYGSYINLSDIEVPEVKPYEPHWNGGDLSRMQRWLVEVEYANALTELKGYLDRRHDAEGEWTLEEALGGWYWEAIGTRYISDEDGPKAIARLRLLGELEHSYYYPEGVKEEDDGAWKQRERMHKARLMEAAIAWKQRNDAMQKDEYETKVAAEVAETQAFVDKFGTMVNPATRKRLQPNTVRVKLVKADIPENQVSVYESKADRYLTDENGPGRRLNHIRVDWYVWGNNEEAENMENRIAHVLTGMGLVIVERGGRSFWVRGATDVTVTEHNRHGLLNGGK